MAALGISNCLFALAGVQSGIECQDKFGVEYCY